MANLESYRRYLEGSGNGLHFGVCLDQGQKKTMEDSHTASVALDGSFSSWSFFGVYDGHRGDTVSQYCAAHLLRCIMNTEEISQLYEEVLPAQEKDDLIRRGLVKGFLRVDEELRQLSEIQSGAVQGGSTATCALVTPEWIYLANCGDSRGMIVSQQGTVVLATRDHKPNTKTERQRIERAGLSVERGRVVGVVNSRIAMSRSLGDFRYKAASTLDALQQAVSPEPDIFRWSRTAQDEFIVLASDGVWDTLSNDGVCGVIRRGLQFTND
ncbi:protein phosphatase 1B-like, partial [Paramacrobiotus metropolitanus]|uniref:protein phosphatase 1B-like n=1 Tax=Paramacrobiotus metropolitanus TaxID=2943436 RepID=UPI002445C0C6